MHQFHASALFRLHAALHEWVLAVDQTAVVPREWWQQNEQLLKSYRTPFIQLGMSASRVSFDRLVQGFEKDGCKWGDLTPIIKELLGRLVDETGDRTFFSLSLKELQYFHYPRQGWEAVIARFPSIVGDVEEAYRCFALSRFAASVFHSVQLVEAGLIEMGTFLKVADPKSGWTAVSNALNAVIKKDYKARTRFERTNYAFLEQVHGTVEGLKNAWRNKISHVHGKLTLMTTDFSPDVADEILFASRGFMRRLAEGIPQPKKKNGGG